jgi:hypothetical protein
MMGDPIVKVSVVAIIGLEGVESEQNIQSARKEK